MSKNVSLLEFMGYYNRIKPSFMTALQYSPITFFSNSFSNQSRKYTIHSDFTIYCKLHILSIIVETINRPSLINLSIFIGTTFACFSLVLAYVQQHSVKLCVNGQGDFVLPLVSLKINKTLFLWYKDMPGMSKSCFESHTL